MLIRVCFIGLVVHEKLENFSSGREKPSNENSKRGLTMKIISLNKTNIYRNFFKIFYYISLMLFFPAPQKSITDVF
jgi:hypothetical protein